MRDIASFCPICGRPAAAPSSAAGKRSTAPFCSTRCADVDLGRWFTDQYRIQAERDEDREHGGLAEEAGPHG